MDVQRIVKWLVVLAFVVVAWKYVVPWAKKQNFGGRSSEAAGVSGNSTCTRSAQRASETWGSGLARFMNPPYDMNAWSTFRGDVDSKINGAEAECSCTEPPCEPTRRALGELRTLVGEMDTAIRNGTSPPEDLVARQERIDTLISGE